MKRLTLTLLIALVLAACNMPATPEPAAPPASPDYGTAISAVRTVEKIASETAAPAVSPTPVVVYPTPTNFQPSTPSPYIQVVGKIVHENGQVWVESYFNLVARDMLAKNTNEYVEMRLQINSSTVWRGNSNGGELISPKFVLNDGDVVQVFVDEILVAHLGDLEFDTFVNR